MKYQIEIECEKEISPSDNIYICESIDRRTRYSLIFNSFRILLIPLLNKYWPYGLKYEQLRIVPPLRVFEDISCLRLVTGKSTYPMSAESYIYEKRYDIVKRKYDGRRNFAVFRDTSLWCESSFVFERGDDFDSSHFCGLHVYQLESINIHKDNILSTLSPKSRFSRIIIVS